MRSFEKRKREGHASATFFDPKIQKKIKTGTPGDKFEVEADQVASKVVAHSTKSGGMLQAKEEEVQQKPISDAISQVQKKDMKEEEPIQKKEEEKVQKKEGEEETVQKKEEEQEVQKKTDEKEETVQKKSSSVQPSTQTKLKNTKGGGYAMNKSVLMEMNAAFQADFSEVRIHTDTDAIALCQEMGALAFTNGKDIYFNKGKYNPTSKSGKELLAHELTHTIQQGAVSKNNI
ncbi:conserved hypothetical protein [Flavobacterium sp. 9AF]|uniref:eCIS core domain-containing protein n=1 Tax=Flavobacterium sp. 9AF TaxID=2653142 RepID=UPI0012EFFD9E|nr:DUF4157 domain-containing protein [Flavobacterium sp. 9AF]VXB29779.1 conserved hypothetical protein [Flavobacterium sp. 9AF]